MYRRRQGCGTTWARREQFRAGFHFQGRTQRGKLASVQGNLSKAVEPQKAPARLNFDAAGVCPRGLMLILKYFLVVGTVLTMGLIALNAHLLPTGSTAPAVVHSATSASLPTVAPKAQPAEPDLAVAAEPSPPPAKPAKSSRRSERSARAHGRSR
jgi:hypothetical protein